MHFYGRGRPIVCDDLRFCSALTTEPHCGGDKLNSNNHAVKLRRQLIWWRRLELIIISRETSDILTNSLIYFTNLTRLTCTLRSQRMIRIQDTTIGGDHMARVLIEIFIWRAFHFIPCHSVGKKRKAKRNLCAPHCHNIHSASVTNSQVQILLPNTNERTNKEKKREKKNSVNQSLLDKTN